MWCNIRNAVIPPFSVCGEVVKESAMIASRILEPEYQNRETQ